MTAVSLGLPIGLDTIGGPTALARRLFTGTAHGITAFCSRPSLLATFLWGTREPDVDGWRSYAACGYFGGDSSPIRGVRLLKPGERVVGRRRPGGGWEMASEPHHSADDIVADGMAAQAAGVDAAIDLAAEGMLATANGICELYPGQITLGLSGGKDSRVIAAGFLATDKPVETPSSYVVRRGRSVEAAGRAGSLDQRCGRRTGRGVQVSQRPRW
jgi:asparagine synthase (glutamine-hydrolysing)